MERYDRHIRLAELGEAGQRKLSAARVLVIGAGGLGCAVLPYLAAAGVGTLGVMDGDVVALSNLQRQVLYREADIGKNKAEVAVGHLQQLNSTLRYEPWPHWLQADNALATIRRYDLVVDATDNFRSRYLINDACLLADKPFVHAALYKFEGQLSVFNYQGGPSYRCLFPEPPQPGAVPNCNEVGVLGVLPGMLGLLQANEVLKLLLGIGEPLSGKLLSVNLLTNQQYSFSFERNEARIAAITARGEPRPIPLNDCPASGRGLALNDVSHAADYLWVDLREPDESPELSAPWVQRLPWSEFSQWRDQLPADRKVLLFCASGQRARVASEALAADHVYFLTDSIDHLSAWMQDYEQTHEEHIH